MKNLTLSDKANNTVKRLISSKNSKIMGFIAAIDPQSGEVYYGKSIVDASKLGRKEKKDPKAIFFFVRVGYPSVHVLRLVTLKGYIDPQCFPVINGYIYKNNLKLQSLVPLAYKSYNFIADTGFSGSIVLDTEILLSIKKDYLGEDNVTLAGGVNYPVKVYLSNVLINSIILNEVEITEMKGENLIGISLMRAFCKRAIFDFDKNEIIFEN